MINKYVKYTHYFDLQKQASGPVIKSWSMINKTSNHMKWISLTWHLLVKLWFDLVLIGVVQIEPFNLLEFWNTIWYLKWYIPGPPCNRAEPRMSASVEKTWTTREPQKRQRIAGRIALFRWFTTRGGTMQWWGTREIEWGGEKSMICGRSWQKTIMPSHGHRL